MKYEFFIVEYNIRFRDINMIHCTLSKKRKLVIQKGGFLNFLIPAALESDAENYMRHKLQGGRLYLKKGVIPHIFDCQQERKVAASTERATKRQRRNEVINLLHISDNANSSTNSPSVHQDLDISNEFSTPTYCDAAVQVDIRIKPLYRSKATNTRKIETADVACITTTTAFDIACNTSSPCYEMEDSASENDEMEADPEYDLVDDSDSDFELEMDSTEANQQIRRCMTDAVLKHSLMCLGIPLQIIFLIEFLSKKAKCSPLHIIICLKKIKMGDSYEYLAMLFGMSPSNVARIFKRTVCCLAAVLQNFIIWPEREVIRRCLPIAFRARYGETQSIIDCFEIRIDKPSNPVYQSLTWSEYKKSNTLKYLISCTPDGTVSFVSRGYGGRTSDALVFEDSGYMENLLPNLDVMADRGFKNVAHLLQQKSCRLVRPPSVSKDVPMSAEDVKASKRIAALRIHVERVIGRLKFFHMCSPDACIDHNHLQIFDHVIVVVCGLINLQSKLIKS
ncbi:uncharacterized protein LOC129230199 [Uloborus diversus]|uniref:uncharacterized protein LOC129230199 n=1 Tax=Uloborus diversus TaxID=327109 RepID=UPI0024095828|nr:uncharacterized protein LOC129230199 [Uloborus diversus]